MTPNVLDMNDPVPFNSERPHTHPFQPLPGHRFDRISPDIRDLHRCLILRVGTRAFQFLGSVDAEGGAPERRVRLNSSKFRRHHEADDFHVG